MLRKTLYLLLLILPTFVSTASDIFRVLSPDDETWFINMGITSYLDNFKNTTMPILEAGSYKVLEDTPSNIAIKTNWLRSLLRTDFVSYVHNKTYNTAYNNLVYITDNKAVGFILYQLDKANNSIYIGQIVVHQDYKRQKIASKILTKIMNNHPEITTYKALLLTPNDIAYKFFLSLKFKQARYNADRYSFESERYQTLIFDK